MTDREFALWLPDLAKTANRTAAPGYWRGERRAEHLQLRFTRLDTGNLVSRLA